MRDFVDGRAGQRGGAAVICRAGRRGGAAAVVLGALLAASGLGSGADAATHVRPHVFADGSTLVDLAEEGLHPWGLYDSPKGFAPAGSAFLAAGGPAGAPPAAAFAGGGGEVGDASRRGPAGPCYWRHQEFGMPAHFPRCGYPSRPGGGGAGPVPTFAGGGGGGGGGGGLWPIPGGEWPLPGDGGDGGGGIEPPGDRVPTPIPLPPSGLVLLAGIAALLARRRSRPGPA